MAITPKLLSRKRRPNVVTLSDEKKLDDLVLQEYRAGYVNPWQWYRSAKGWARIYSAIDSPYRRHGINSEFLLIQRYLTLVVDCLKTSWIVVFGVGTAEKETSLVQGIVNEVNEVTCVAVDINIQFLRGFAELLKQRCIQLDCRIRFLGIQARFEDLERQHMEFSRSRSVPMAIVCLGNTIGNHRDPREAFSIFDRVLRSGDYLFLGYMLDTNLELVLEQYSSNVAIKEWLNDVKPRRCETGIQWRLDASRKEIQAWCDGIQVFRTRRFQPQDMLRLAGKFGFESLFLETDVDSGTAIHMFRKTGQKA